MADSQTIDDVAMEDEYDEDADSDFQEDALVADASEPSSDDDDDAAGQPPTKKRKLDNATAPLIQELDSGDEATIKEQKKHRRKQNKTVNVNDNQDASDHESGEWRARTRAMRDKEKDERKKNKLATSKGSTIDVDKIWEEMNRPTPIAAPRIEGDDLDKSLTPNPNSNNPVALEGDKENLPGADLR